MARSTNQRRRTHLKTATAPTSAKDKHGTRDSQVRHTRLAGRGGKSPKPPLGKRNAPRQRRQGERGRAIVGKTRRALQRQRRRAEGQRQFSRQVGTFLAQAPRRGFGGCRAVVKRERRPKTPRRRANGFVGTSGDFAHTRYPPTFRSPRRGLNGWCAAARG